MENNEMTNELMENLAPTDDFDNMVDVPDSDNGISPLKTAAIIGGIVAGGYLLYRFAIKPIWAKIKKAREEEEDYVDAEFCECDD